VGERHGEVAVLEVAAGKMYRDGYEFFISENGVWLTDHVPVNYLHLV
jgi:putative RNA 2'-phosphotransferase